MKIYWVLLGLFAYAIILFSPVAGLLRIPPPTNIFESDASQYSAGAIHLIAQRFYSLDGVHPYFEREPGQSVLLAVSYLFFGEENPIGIFIIHSLLLIIVSFIFSTEISRRSTDRAGGITFILLLTSGSTLQATFSANRELLALVLLMGLATIYLKRKSSFSSAALMGVLLGALFLTYYPFLFLLIPFSLLWLLDKRPSSLLAICLISCLAIVSFWCTRNALQTGHFTLVEGRRAAITLYSRGEQAERLRGLEPLRCLWSEYISRDWTNRSNACSVVGLWHQRWPKGIESIVDVSLEQSKAKAKILTYPIAHLWISLFDVMELHLPFVGGGWSRTFNYYATILHIILYTGVILGIRFFSRKEWRILIVLPLYTIVVFSLSDGIPRYLTPIIFCYCAFAGMGFDAFAKFLSSKLIPSRHS